MGVGLAGVAVVAVLRCCLGWVAGWAVKAGLVVDMLAVGLKARLWAEMRSGLRFACR